MAIHEIQDDYEDYLDDTLGYAFDAWDLINEDDRQKHDAIAFARTLPALDIAGLNELECWAYAKRLQKSGDMEGFLAAAIQVWEAESDHPALDRLEIGSVLVKALNLQDRPDEAKLILSKMSDAWKDHVLVTLTEVGHLLHHSKEAGLEEMEKVFGKDDVELAVDFAQLLMDSGHFEDANSWLIIAKDAALRTNDHAVMVDIELITKRVTEEYTAS